LLLVEDDPPAARALVRLVRGHCEVSLASTVHEAREQLTTGSRWRAFIVDEGLPDGSGVDLLAEWRPVFPDTPALVLTGCTDARVINAVFDLRADYLVKPAEASRVMRFLLQPTAEGVSRQSIPAASPPDGSPLVSCIQRLRELQLGRADARSRYRMGAIVLEVKRRPDLYGTRGVSALAAGIGEAEQNLYRYATVAERWSVAEFEALVSRRGSDGRPLSWSHLVLIASVDPETTRARLLQRALDESLSVRALAVMLSHGGSGSEPSGSGRN
jgi:CheY-like chemotaxis protein